MKDLIPPHALDLEKAVLGAILIEKEAITHVIDLIPNGDVFYSNSHKLIYKAVVNLFKEGEPIDILTVIERVRKNGDFETVGGNEKATYYISTLTINVNSSAHITTHAKILIEKFGKRQIIERAMKMIKGAYDNSTSFFDSVDMMQNDVIEMSNYVKSGGGFSSYLEMTGKAIEYLEGLRSGKIKSNRISCGFKSLDKVWKLMGAGESTVIAARPGMGKSALVLAIGNYVGMILNKKVAIFSLEMTKEEWINRTISTEARIPSGKLKTGIDITESEWQRIISATDYIAPANIHVDATPSISITSLRAKLKSIVIRLGGLDLVIIDYMQLVKASVKGNREQEIALISRTIKELSKELDVPIISLAQMNREAIKRGGDKRPIISDLRESGSIEQDADQIIFINRPEIHGITEDEEGESTLGLAEIIFAKNRHGDLDTVKLKFEGKYTRFEEWEENEWESKNEYPSQDYEPLQNSSEFDFIP